MKHTPWFPAKVKPVRVWYRYWDGEYWHFGGSTPIEAKSHANTPGSRLEETPIEPWRGLAEEPK
jgi:hypothetical protein